MDYSKILKAFEGYGDTAPAPPAPEPRKRIGYVDFAPEDTGIGLLHVFYTGKLVDLLLRDILLIEKR